MANFKDNIFRFQQFSLSNRHSAMKVGTDGVLLGAWADVGGALRVLDIGAGTGLLSLMVAQRNDSASIIAVEIDDEAAAEAAVNVANSPWHDRVEVLHSDINCCRFDEAFDLIICNPPFFKNSLAAVGNSRNTARHEQSLSIDTLMRLASQWLTPGGRLALVAPVERRDDIDFAASMSRLNLLRLVEVKTKPTGPVRRLLCEFTPANVNFIDRSQLCIHEHDGTYSPAFSSLTSQFYL